MKNIDQYLDQIRIHVLEMKGDMTLIDEYESHLLAEFEDYITNCPECNKKGIEEKFVQKLESPEHIAKAFVFNSSNHRKRSRSNLLITRIEKINLFAKKHPIITGFVCFLIFYLGVALSYSLSLINTPMKPSVLDLLLILFYGFLSSFSAIRYFLLFLALPIILFFLFGNKNRFKDVLKAGIFLSLISASLSSLISMFNGPNLVEFPNWVGHITEDWIHISKPTEFEYIIHLLDNLIIREFFLPFLFILVCGMIGHALKTLYLNQNDVKSLIMKIDRPTKHKFVFFVLSVTFLFILIPNYQYLPRYYIQTPLNTPPPTPTESALLYDLRISSTTNGMPSGGPNPFTSKILEFGNITFQEPTSLFQVKFEADNLSLIGSDSVCMMEPAQDEATRSQFYFPIFGILYLPLVGSYQTWDELVKIEFNTSFPLRDFRGEIDETINQIDWQYDYTHGGLRIVKIPVTTIKYTSVTDNSIYIFSFDSRTGWLMKANLFKDGTWIDGFSAETFSLVRLFREEELNHETQMESYKLVDFMVSIAVFIVATSAIMILGSYKMRNRKKTHFYNRKLSD